MKRLFNARSAASLTTLVVASVLLAPAGAGATVAETWLLAPYTVHDRDLSPGSVGIGDVTGDGRADLLMTSTHTSDDREWSLFVYAQRPDGSLGSPRRIDTSGGYYSDMPLGVADLDGDHDLDVAVGSTAGVDVFLQGADGLTLDDTVGGFESRDLTTADLDADGVAEILVCSSAGVQILRRAGGGYDVESLAREGREVEVGDVSGDGLPDVVVIGRQIEVSRQLEDGSLAAPVAYGAGSSDVMINGLAIGDVNADSMADVVVSVGGNGPSAKVVTRVQLEDGTLGPAQAKRSYDIPQAITVADVSGDGLGDVITLHGGWGTMGVYRQQGGALAAEDRYEIPGLSHYNPKAIAVGDISGDGRPDIALADAGLVVFRTRLPYADLGLTVSDRSIRYGARTTATIELEGAAGRRVTLLARAGGRERTLASGTVDRRGTWTVPVTLTRNTVLVATYAGDDTVGPTETSVQVEVAAKLTPKPSNTYGRSGRYHLVRDENDPILGVRLSVPDAERCLAFDFQGHIGGRWQNAGGNSCVRTDDLGRAGIRLTGVPTGTDVRMRARFKGSSLNGAARTPWVYFRVTP